MQDGWERLLAFRAAIFDLDGTLIDSEPRHLRAWLDLSVKYGFKPFDMRFIAQVGGISTEKIAGIIIRDNGLSLAAPALGAEKTALYKEKYMREVPVFPAIATLLREAHAHGLKTAVATGSQQPETLFLLRRHGLADAVDTVVSSDQVENCKPAPDTYLEAARRLRVPPAECAVFEDTVLGAQGVAAAGMALFKVAQGKIVSLPA